MRLLVDVLDEVGEPAVRAVFATREVSVVRLLRSAAGGCMLRMVVVDETYEHAVVQPDIASSCGEWREQLRFNLVDFVAESGFGGLTREHGPPA